MLTGRNNFDVMTRTMLIVDELRFDSKLFSSKLMNEKVVSSNTMNAHFSKSLRQSSAADTVRLSSEGGGNAQVRPLFFVSRVSGIHPANFKESSQLAGIDERFLAAINLFLRFAPLETCSFGWTFSVSVLEK